VNYAFAMTATPEELLQALDVPVTAASGPADAKAMKLAQNHGFLKGLMKRVGKHFQDAGAGAVRILKSGVVWSALLATIVTAVSLLFDARRLRHYQMQPGLGKMRVFGVGLSFLFFIGSFLTFFKKIAAAWKNQSETDEEKAKAEALLARLSDAERAALVARAQAQKQQHAAASVTGALGVLASTLVHENVDMYILTAKTEDGLIRSARAWVRKNTVTGVKMFRSLAKDPQKSRTAFVLAALSLLVLKIGSEGISAWYRNDLVSAREIRNVSRVFDQMKYNPDRYSNVPGSVLAAAAKAGKALQAVKL